MSGVEAIPPSRRAWLSLGANLGDPAKALAEAAREIRAIPSVLAVRLSSLYRTSPVDSSGPEYVNAAAAVTTTLEPEELLHALQAIELGHGRVRPAGVRNAPRTLDLDILAVEGVTSATRELMLPHPRMNDRLFVLVPLSEIEPGWRSPEGVPVAELIRDAAARDPGQTITRLA